MTQPGELYWRGFQPFSTTISRRSETMTFCGLRPLSTGTNFAITTGTNSPFPSGRAGGKMDLDDQAEPRGRQIFDTAGTVHGSLCQMSG